MKILYVITKSNWGGAQRHVFDLATAMRDKGHEVKVALGGEGLLKKKLEAAGIFTYSISPLVRDVSLRGDFESLKQIWGIIRNWRPQVLHLHSPKAAGLGSVAGRLLRVKNIILTVHGWTWNENRPIWQRGLIVFFSWLTGALCHKVIVISNRDLEQGARLPGFKEKVSLIPLGVSSSALYSVEGARQFMAKTIGMNFSEYSKRIVVGTVAELHPNKGLTYLVNAMSMVAHEYPQALCLIVGDGQDRNNLEALVKEKRLENSVKLLGYVDGISDYLKAFNIFVLPSIKEGLPYVIMEAGLASLPVAASNIGGIPDLIDDIHSGILIQPKHTRELAHAISFLIEHPEKRRDYGTNLKAKIRDKFSIEKMVTEVEKMYEQAQSSPVASIAQTA